MPRQVRKTRVTAKLCIDRKHASGNGGHASRHQCHELTLGHPGNVGFDQQRCFGVSNKAVGGGCQRFTT